MLESVYIPLCTTIFLYLFDYKRVFFQHSSSLQIASRAILVCVTLLHGEWVLLLFRFLNSEILPPINWEGLKRTHYNFKKK